MSYLLQDKELGIIAVTVNARSRRFIFRYKDGMLACTSPCPYRKEELQRAIDELRPKLKALLKRGKEKEQTKRYTPETRIDAEDFHVSFQQKDVPVAEAKMSETNL